MKDFILQNWATILIIVLAAAWGIFLAVNKKWDELRLIAYKLMIRAEKTITGTKRGQERFEQVFQQIYSLIPSWLQFFLDEVTVREKLQEWYVHIKDAFDNGMIDGSAKPPDTLTI
jgi:hypothetical protein